MPTYSFTREERLRGRKVFTDMFSKGRSLHIPPYRITWQAAAAVQGRECLQAAFVVPKRNFKKASQRNRIRRRMKEAYRMHKSALRNQLTETGGNLLFVCLYTGREECLYPEIESKIIVTLQRLAKETREQFPTSQTQQP
jgi:ribonuclease P protein component